MNIHTSCLGWLVLVAQRAQHMIQDGTETPEACSPQDGASLLEVDDVMSTPSSGSVTTSLSATMVTSRRASSSSVAGSLSTELSEQIRNADSKPLWKIYLKHFEPCSS